MLHLTIISVLSCLVTVWLQQEYMPAGNALQTALGALGKPKVFFLGIASYGEHAIVLQCWHRSGLRSILTCDWQLYQTSMVCDYNGSVTIKHNGSVSCMGQDRCIAIAARAYICFHNSVYALFNHQRCEYVAYTRICHISIFLQ